MNNIKLTDGDIRAIIKCTKAMPSYSPFDAGFSADSIYLLTMSCAAKLMAEADLNSKETLFVSLSIDNAYKALRNEIYASQNTIASLSPYLLTINKLHPLFAPILDKIP